MAFLFYLPILFVVLFLLKGSQSENSIIYTKYIQNQKNTVSSTELSEVIHLIGKHYFSENFFIHLTLPTENGNIKQVLDTVTGKVANNCTVTINDNYHNRRFVKEGLIIEGKIIINYLPDLYIIPVKKEEDFEYFDTQILIESSNDFFNPRAIFILILSTVECQQLDYSNVTSQYFNYLWKLNVMSVIILVLSDCDSSTTFLTARPFSIRNPCREIFKEGITHHSMKLTIADLKANIYNYYNHNNFNKCNFLVATTPHPPYVVGKKIENENQTYYEYVGGIDIELVRLYSNIYNFTCIFDNSNGYGSDAWFKFLPNNMVGGITVDVLWHKTDMAFGGLMPSQRNYYKYDYSTSYKYSSISWFVRDAGLSPLWKIFFGTFSLAVWICSIAAFITACLMYVLLDNLNLESLTVKCSLDTRDMSFLEMIRVALSLPSILEPRSNYLRVLFMTLYMFSLHLTIAYSSILFLLITNPPLEKEIATVNDIKKSGLKVGAVPVFFEVFKAVSLDSTTRQILDNNFECPDLDTCVKQLTKYRNFSLMEKTENVEHVLDLKKANIHRISESAMGSGVSIMTSKGNPLSPGVTKVAIKAFESGLISKWEKDANQFSKVIKHTVSEEPSVPLSYSTLKGCFFILIGGHTISFSLFLIELSCNSFKKSKYCRLF